LPAETITQKTNTCQSVCC